MPGHPFWLHPHSPECLYHMVPGCKEAGLLLLRTPKDMSGVGSHNPSGAYRQDTNRFELPFSLCLIHV